MTDGKDEFVVTIIDEESGASCTHTQGDLPTAIRFALRGIVGSPFTELLEAMADEIAITACTVSEARRQKMLTDLDEFYATARSRLGDTK